MTDSTRRRSFLGAVFGVGIATVAGCLEGSDADDTAGTDDEPVTGTSDEFGSPAGGGRADGSDGLDSGPESGDDGTNASETADGERDDSDGTDRDDEDGAEGTDGDDVATYDVDEAVSMTVELDDEEKQAIAPGDVETVSDVQHFGLFNVPYVSVTVSEDGTESFVAALETIDAFDDPSSTDLHTVRDGDRLHTSTLGSDLAEQVRRGEFEGTFNTSFGNEEQAERHIEALTAG